MACSGTGFSSIDLSPISMRALLLCRTTIGLSVVRDRYEIKSLNSLLRLAGAGYRVLARSGAHLSSRWERIRVFCSKPNHPSFFDPS